MSNKEIFEEIMQRENINYVEFGKRIGIKGKPTTLYDIRDGKIKSITPKMADKILAAFPHYNRAWLLSGEGNILADSVRQTNQSGDNIHGRHVTVNKTEKDYIDIIKKQAEQLSKSQSHIDHLLSIIDRLQKE